MLQYFEFNWKKVDSFPWDKTGSICFPSDKSAFFPWPSHLQLLIYCSNMENQEGQAAQSGNLEEGAQNGQLGECSKNEILIENRTTLSEKNTKMA